MNRGLPILIAEDSDDDVVLLQRALRRNEINNEVHIVRDGREAIAYLSGEGKYSDRSSYPFPSLIISDIKMPGKSGLEILKWLKAHPKCRLVPVIILTASSEERDISEAYGLGANAYLVKPAAFPDLVHMVRVLHEFWSLCQKPKIPTNCGDGK